MKNFIQENQIFNTLSSTDSPAPSLVREVLAKGLEKKGLSMEETAVLLQTEDDTLIQEIFEAAHSIKKDIYGNRLVLFAPLYVSNECTNDCLYCGFRASNTKLKRRTLSTDEVREEVKILENMGHKRVLLVYGEAKNIDYMKKTIDAVYDTREGTGEIRRVNVNAAPMSVEDFKILKSTDIGTYQCFQETYHRETYEKMHPAGKKADYLWRLHALDRAQEAGIDDIATGVLFGLFDWKFEVLALLQHAFHLEEKFGVGPHTISFPRLEPALNAPVSVSPPYPVNDKDFKKLVAILRIAVPYTGLILTTRETPELRRELFDLGVSQISAGSKTYPGGYKEAQAHAPDIEQFTLGDIRPLDDVIYDMVGAGYVPSFCTACYRLGRTGEDFMNMAKPGDIHMFCDPNALLTFAEYLEDYASPETREKGWKMIEQQSETIREDFQPKFQKELKEIREGKRDLYF
jgi:2-iminoacetate synthase